MSGRILEAPRLGGVHYPHDLVVLSTWSDGVMVTAIKRSRLGVFRLQCVEPHITTNLPFKFEPREGRVTLMSPDLGITRPKRFEYMRRRLDTGTYGRWNWFLSAAFPAGHVLQNFHVDQEDGNHPPVEGVLGEEFDVLSLLGLTHPVWGGDDEAFRDWVDSIR